jgi:F0F1-type ATP synthase membrane subunit b/b'
VQQETDVREERTPASDLPPADWAAADEMRRRTFTVSEQGYDQEEVRGYLTHLAEVFANQASQLAELRRVEAQRPPAQNGGEDASGLATKIADVLKEAEEHAARLREEAEGEAKLILAGAQQRAEQAEREVERRVAQAQEQARQQADRVAAQARQQAEEAGGRAQARVQEAERKTAEASALRDAVLSELRSAFDRISRLSGSGGSGESPTQPESAVPAPPAPTRPA